MRGKKTVREKFVADESRRLKDGWHGEESVEDKWQVMKSALCDAAEYILGTASTRQADWFVESEGPLLEKRRGAYLKWLDTGGERDT